MVHEPSDLTAIVFDGVDKLQHLAYRFVDPAYVPQHPNAWETSVINRCHDYFRQVDDFLANPRNRGGQGRVFIASDHGFTATTELVYINRWLHDQGLLAWRTEVPEDKDGIDRRRTTRRIYRCLDHRKYPRVCLDPQFQRHLHHQRAPQNTRRSAMT